MKLLNRDTHNLITLLLVFLIIIGSYSMIELLKLNIFLFYFIVHNNDIN